MSRSPFGELPGQGAGSGVDPPAAEYWPGQRTTWGGRGRASVVVVLGVLGALLVAVLAVTFLSDSDAGSGTAAVGNPPPVLASEGLAPTTPLQLGGYTYEVGVGPFAASTRGSTADAHLLLAPIVVRNTSGAPAPNPSSTLRVRVALAALPASVTTGPSAVLCQNRPASSPLGTSPATYPGLAPGACVLEARASGSAGTLAPGDQARGTVLSTPIPDAVTDTAATLWVETTPGAWQRVG